MMIKMMTMMMIIITSVIIITIIITMTAMCAGLEFAYTQSPASMQGVMMGVFLATSGLGNYLATAILKIVEVATEDGEVSV